MGVPFPIALALAALLSAAVGVIVGLPALRVKGIYLGIATLSFGFIVEEVLARWESVTGGNSGIHVKQPDLFGYKVDSAVGFYFLCLVIAIVATLGILNLLRSPPAAPSSPSATLKSRRRAWASTWRATRRCLCAVGGAGRHRRRAVCAQAVLHLARPVQHPAVDRPAFDGGDRRPGLGARRFLGAIFLISMPQVIAMTKDYLPPVIGQAPGLQGVVYGAVLIAFVLFEPLGLYGRWLKIAPTCNCSPFYRKGLFKRQKSFQKSDRLK
jgi:branched-chain amino acid transport system permease protein